MKTSRPRDFFWEEFLIYELNFLKNYNYSNYLYHIGRTVVVCVFWGSVLFHLKCQIICVELFTVFLYYPFDVYRICSDFPYVISNIGNLCFIFVSRSLSHCAFSWVFSNQPVFQFPVYSSFVSNLLFINCSWFFFDSKINIWYFLWTSVLS